MHSEFYLNDKFTSLEEVNAMFNDGIKIRDYLRSNLLQCGYALKCKTTLIPAMFQESKTVYLKTKKGNKHIKDCPFHDLLRIREKMLATGTLDFLIINFPKRRINQRSHNTYDKTNELISGEQKSGTYIKLAELFALLKNDLKLVDLKKTSLIDPENCEQWYKDSGEIENNAVLLTGRLTKKFKSCTVKGCYYNCFNNNHEVKDYKLEIVENDIEFHISVSKDIFLSIEYLPSSEKIKKYHILARLNQMKRSNDKNKRFYTKHSTPNHIVTNKKMIEEIEG